MMGKLNTRPRAVALFSGGLDSTLAVNIMLEQGIKITAVYFDSPFSSRKTDRAGAGDLASAVAEKLGVEIRIINKGLEYLKLVEKPRFGYGRGMNPCLDCRIFMLKKAAVLMKEKNAGFVVTGEVLGQRPMSQHRAALALVEKESGLIGRILRPLSAHWLDPTVPEQNGWVDRSRLLAIRGRSRSEQLALAKQKGLNLFGTPAGGCLLCEPAVARRLKDMFVRIPNYDMSDAELTTFARHFRPRAGLKVIMGRNHDENERMRRVAPELPRMELADIPGPLMLIRGELTETDRLPLGRLLKRYATKANAETAAVQYTCGGHVERWNISGYATDKETNCRQI